MLQSFLRRFLDRYFKFLFALMLLGFVLMIFLMNVPRLLAAGQETIGKGNATATTSATDTPPLDYTIPENFYRWNFSKPAIPLQGEGYFELGGSKLSLVLRF